MSDRKYRQRGYQDEGPRERRPGIPRPQEKHDPRIPRDPRTPNMPGFKQVFRCARCGHVESTDVGPGARCGKCGVDLHACIHCNAFDSSAPFECREKMPARISPKDAANQCALFAPRVTVERETGSTPASGTSAAKRAFDDLFKL